MSHINSTFFSGHSDKACSLFHLVNIGYPMIIARKCRLSTDCGIIRLATRFFTFPAAHSASIFGKSTTPRPRLRKMVLVYTYLPACVVESNILILRLRFLPLISQFSRVPTRVSTLNFSIYSPGSPPGLAHFISLYILQGPHQG